MCWLVVLLALAVHPGASPGGAQTAVSTPNAVVPQAFPVIVWLTAVRENDQKRLSVAFSERMQQILEAEGWEIVLKRYQTSFGKAFGDYRLEDFAFTYVGGDGDGKVAIMYRGKALPGVMVVREPSGWKVNER